MALGANALTTLTAMEVELGLSVGADDSYLSRLINAASDRVERYCDRSFYYAAAEVEKTGGYGGFYLLTDRVPILVIASITYDDETVDAGDYEIDTASSGMIRSSNGFIWTAGTITYITRTPLPGTERKLYEITFEGGYVTPEQAQAKGTLTFTGQPTATDTMVINGTTITAIATGAVTNQFNIGTTLRDTLDNLAAAINACDESGEVRAERSGTTVIVTWTEPGTGGNAIVFTTALTNSTANGSGTLGGTQLGKERTLPYALEDAAIQLAVKRYRRKGKDPGIKSTKLMSSATVFAGPSTGDSEMGLPTEIAQTLNTYARLAQA